MQPLKPDVPALRREVNRCGSSFHSRRPLVQAWSLVRRLETPALEPLRLEDWPLLAPLHRTGNDRSEEMSQSHGERLHLSRAERSLRRSRRGQQHLPPPV